MSVFDKYDLLKTIGTGAFSEVKIGVDRTTGHQYAIKIVDRAKCKGKENMIETEVSILKRVKHENIIQLYEMFEVGGKIYLVMELVTGGELFDDIVKAGKYTEKDTAKIVHKILCAVDYLHFMGIVHRDLKPENLLLSDSTKNAKIMISDFGLSKIFNDDEVMKTACGTPGYVAPEVLKRQGYGREVDLWSLGVITYILLCGYPPFYDPNNVELFKKIMSGKFEFDKPWWDSVSEKAKDFIRHLLVLDPKTRATATTALQHPFIVDHCGPTEPAAIKLAREGSNVYVPDRTVSFREPSSNPTASSSGSASNRASISSQGYKKASSATGTVHTGAPFTGAIPQQQSAPHRPMSAQYGVRHSNSHPTPMVPYNPSPRNSHASAHHYHQHSYHSAHSAHLQAQVEAQQQAAAAYYGPPPGVAMPMYPPGPAGMGVPMIPMVSGMPPPHMYQPYTTIYAQPPPHQSHPQQQHGNTHAHSQHGNNQHHNSHGHHNHGHHFLNMNKYFQHMSLGGGRPLGQKTPLDDSGIVSSNEGLAQNQPKPGQNQDQSHNQPAPQNGQQGQAYYHHQARHQNHAHHHQQAQQGHPQHGQQHGQHGYGSRGFRLTSWFRRPEHK